MIFGGDRRELRRIYVDAWRRRREGLPMEPLAHAVAGVVEAHPEYHALLDDPEACERDFVPESGGGNPFLHMGMHLAIQEQLSTDRPAGFSAIYRSLVARHSNAHALEHEIMECLGACLWQAQRSGQPPDEAAYLECVRRLGGGVARGENPKAEGR